MNTEDKVILGAIFIIIVAFLALLGSVQYSDYKHAELGMCEYVVMGSESKVWRKCTCH